MRVKAFLVHKKKKKFVNVKPVRFLHSTRSEMKKKKIKAYVEQVTTKKWPFFDSHSQESRCRSCTSPFLELSFGERPGQGCWFYKYCRSLDILYIYIHKYIYIKFFKIILNYCSFQIANNLTFIIAWKKRKPNVFKLFWNPLVPLVNELRVIF